MMRSFTGLDFRQKITHLIAILSLCFSVTWMSSVHAQGGVQIGLSSQYINLGLYSLSGLDAEDIKGAHQEGFVHTQLSGHFDNHNEAAIVDLMGEAGRFLLSDKRLSIAIGVRPLVGTVKDVSSTSKDKDKAHTLAEIAIGVRLAFTSWLSEQQELNTTIYYYRAPSIVSQGDFSYTAFTGARISLPIIVTSELYVAYDHFSGELIASKGGNNVAILDNLSLGIRLGF